VGGAWKWGLFQLVHGALVVGVGGQVVAVVEIGGLSCIFSYFGGCLGGGWVCMLVHTQRLLRYLM